MKRMRSEKSLNTESPLVGSLLHGGEMTLPFSSLQYSLLFKIGITSMHINRKKFKQHPKRMGVALGLKLKKKQKTQLSIFNDC